MNVRCPQCETLYRVDPSKVPERGVRARCATCATIIPVTRRGDGTGMAAAPARATPQPAAVVPERRPEAVAPEQIIPEPVIPEPVIPEPEPKAAAPQIVRPVPEEEMALPEPVIPEMEAEPETVVPEPPPERRPRYSRPFMPPIQPVDAPSQQRHPTPPRPSAPVFRPTPGTPVKRPSMPAAPAQAGAATSAPAAGPAAGIARRRPINPFLSRDPTQKARRLARALVSDMIVYQPKKRQEALAQGNLKQAFGEEIKKSWEEYVQQIGEETARSTDFFREALNDILAGGRVIFEAGFKF